MVLEAADRSMEFTNPKQHVGWEGGKIPVFAVFSLDMARRLFDEFRPGRVVAICVAIPKAARAENFEQALGFFSDDDVAAVDERMVFGFPY